jgi:CubicO group peptidase (beta-lactamase class C family)
LTAVGAVALALVVGTPVVAAEGREAKVDALFSQWDRPGQPGAAVGIYHHGKVVYVHEYGYADLEHQIKVTPDTEFQVGSVAKEFTAFAAALEAREGKLDLNADIRTYLPWMPDFGRPITVSNLIHHTSGLRDQVALFDLAGLNDALQRQWMVDALMARQRGLNFPTGTEFGYVNTGYTLLGEIVAKTSGESLRTFAGRRIFAPLGMTHTFFHDDVGEIIPNLSENYDKDTPDGPWKHQVVPYDGHVGATNLFTTIDDMMLWTENFFRPTVGDAALIDQVTTPGALADGTPIHYAFGLERGVFAGHPSIYHTGADTGFRAIVALFPKDDFAVVILTNAPLDRKTRVAAIADLYLNGAAGLDRTVAPPRAAPAPTLLRGLVGSYGHDTERTVTLALSGDGLTWRRRGEEPQPVVFRADGTFDLGDEERIGAFYRPITKGADVVGFEKTDDDGIKSRFQRLPAARALPLGSLAGDYHSPEIDTTWTLSVEDGRLVGRTLWRQGKTVFDLVAPDRFESEQGEVTALIVRRDPGGRPNGFLLSIEDVSNLAFDKTAAR